MSNFNQPKFTQKFATKYTKYNFNTILELLRNKSVDKFTLEPNMADKSAKVRIMRIMVNSKALKNPQAIKDMTDTDEEIKDNLWFRVPMNIKMICLFPLKDPLVTSPNDAVKLTANPETGEYNINICFGIDKSPEIVEFVRLFDENIFATKMKTIIESKELKVEHLHPSHKNTVLNSKYKPAKKVGDKTYKEYVDLNIELFHMETKNGKKEKVRRGKIIMATKQLDGTTKMEEVTTILNKEGTEQEELTSKNIYRLITAGTQFMSCLISVSITHSALGISYKFVINECVIVPGVSKSNNSVDKFKEAYADFKLEDPIDIEPDISTKKIETKIDKSQSGQFISDM